MADRDLPEWLKLEIQASKDVRGRSPDEVEINRMLAQRSMETDAQDEGVGFLSSESKEALLLHGRMDAAHAVLNTVSLMRRQRRMERLLWILLALLVFLAVYRVP